MSENLTRDINVINLADRLTTHEDVRSFLAIQSAGPEIAEVLKAALPGLPKDQQRALVAIATWRMLGAFLPASIELLRRLPILNGMHPESIGAQFQLLLDGGVIEVVQHAEGTPDEESAFVWPALERLVIRAVQDANSSKIVGADGKSLR